MLEISPQFPPRAQAVQVRCAQAEEKANAVSRRGVFSFAALSLLLAASEKAEAKDIPLFGIKKRLEPLEKAIESEVTMIEKEGSDLLKLGEKEIGDMKNAIQGATTTATKIDVGGNAGLSEGISPTVQAGGVVGAELFAVLVASSVVNGLISVPSK